MNGPADGGPAGAGRVAADEGLTGPPRLGHGADVDLHIPGGHHRGEQMSRTQQVLYRFMWYVVQGVGRSYFRLDVVGMENVPRHGAFILAPIHRSNLDTPAVAAVSRRRLRYMGKESLWTSTGSAWFFTILGGFPVKRGTVDREALRACIEVIERGEPLVMFPEGTRQTGPEVAEMFDGPAYVSARTGVPIVPVGIGGSERAMGKGSRMVHPAKMTLVVGQPIWPPPATDGGRVSRRAIRELTERLGSEIQVLFDEAQALAGSPNRHP